MIWTQGDTAHDTLLSLLSLLRDLAALEHNMELRLAQFLSSQSWLFVLVIFYAITITYGREADFVWVQIVMSTWAENPWSSKLL